MNDEARLCDTKMSDDSLFKKKRGKHMLLKWKFDVAVSRMALIALGVAFSASPSAVYAQDSMASDAAEAEMGFNDIVVTATRKSRAEALQDVPVAVTAFTGAMIEQAQVKDLTDLGRMAPGARLEGNGTFPASANFFIRGVGINTTNPSDDPTVGIFVDGMYLGTNVGALTDLFDIESVEILRGPQGTLFGRNVTGGAVLVRTRRPSGDFGFRGAVSYGRFEEVGVKAAIEGPIVPDVLNAKLAVMYKDNDGYFSNAARPGDRIGATESLVIRPVVEWKATDNLTLTLIGERGRQDDNGTPTKFLIDKLSLASPPPPGKFDLSSDFPTLTETRWDQIAAEAVLETGSGVLTATASYRRVEIDNQAEIDGSDEALFHFLTPTGLRQSQRMAELVYATSFGDTLDLTVGANIFDQSFTYKEYRQILTTIFQAGRGHVDHTAGGIFAQADWTFVPDVTLTLGGRYTIERKHGVISNFNSCDANFNCTIDTDDKTTWKDFTPKVGLRWTPTPDVTLYGSWTRGFRSGGYNVRNSTGPAGPYEPENVDAYEVGMKTQFLDRRLTLNLAAYRNEFSDLQRQTLDSQARQRTLNAADASIMGLEGELNFMPVRGLVLGGTFAYIDAKYDSFQGLDLTGDGVPDPDLAKQLDFNRVPKWSYSLNGSYTADLNDTLKWSMRASFDHTGRRAGSDTNTFYLNPYGLLNASVTLATIDDKYSLTLFGKNLTNKLYVSTGVDVSFFRSVYIGPPRRWGAEFAFKF